MGELVREAFIQPVLADTSPRFLELRINMDNFTYEQKDWGHIFGTSIRRLTLFLSTRGSNLDKNRMTYMLGCLAVTLPTLPSLRYLVLSFAPMPRRLGSKLSMHWFGTGVSSTESEVMHGIIEMHLRGLAVRSTSLRWIGYEVYGWGMKSWNISRSNGGRKGDSGSGANYVASRLKMAEMGEYESMAVVKKKGMNIFEGVTEA